MRDAGAFGRDRVGRSVGEIAEDLPANGGIGFEKPGEGFHEAMVAGAASEGFHAAPAGTMLL